MPIVPVRISPHGIEKATVESLFLAATTYSNLKLLERHLEDFIVQHPNLLFPEEEETFHILGTHVVNALGDEADVVGLLATGELVVVEVKRDKADIQRRTEPLEWQAFRYAATLATFELPDELVPLLSLHIRNHLVQYGSPPDTDETARLLLKEYLADLAPEESFNHRQRVILVASDFDDRTLAACSWLVQNRVPLKCIRVAPHLLSGTDVVLNVETVLPLPTIEDYLPAIHLGKGAPSKPRESGIREPRLQELLDAGLVNVGDELFVKKAAGRTASIIDGGTVLFEGRRMSPSKWGIEVTSWPTFSVYESAYLKRTGQKVKELRRQIPAPQAAPPDVSPNIDKAHDEEAQQVPTQSVNRPSPDCNETSAEVAPPNHSA